MLGLSRQHYHTMLAVHHIQLDSCITQISWALVDCHAGSFYEPITVRIWKEAERFAPFSLEHTLACLWQTAANVEKDLRSLILVTMGGSLLERVLPTELEGKGFALPAVMNSYIDLVQEFKEHSGRDAWSPAEMSAIMGDTAKVNDIYHMAKVIIAMMARQHVFKTVMYVDRIAGKTINTRAAAGVRRDEPSSAEYCYFKLRGLPFRATKRQVKEFLEATEIEEEEDICYQYFNDKFNGNAFVRAPLSLADSIREKHDKHLMNRYIEVLPSTRDEFERTKVPFTGNRMVGGVSQRQPSMNYQQYPAYEQQPPQYPQRGREKSRSRSRGRGRTSRSASSGSNVSYRSKSKESSVTSNLEEKGIIKMIGLPYSCTRSEVLDFFEPHHPIQASLKFGARDGRRTGDAVILFESKRDAEAAMQLDRKKIGSRYIELSRVNPDAYRKFVW